jgi:hypothetical protein
VIPAQVPPDSLTEPHSGLPVESPAERIREKIACLPVDHPVRSALLNLIPAALGIAATTPQGGGLLSAFGVVGSSLAAWLGERQQAEYNRRVEEVLWALVEEVARLEQLGYTIKPTEAWAETIFNVLPLALRSLRQEKRRLFATLLANGTISSAPESLDECRTMALILDQLEYAHVELLDRFFSQQPTKVDHHGLWGVTTRIPLDSANTELYRDGPILQRLEGVGFLRIIDTAARSPQSLNKAVQLNDLARRFHAWVTRPERGPREPPRVRA